MAESFFSALKNERVYRTVDPTKLQADAMSSPARTVFCVSGHAKLPIGGAVPIGH